MGLNDFKKCRKCGNIFRYMGNVLCPNCINEMEDQFKIVKDFLYKNPNATVKQISDELEIDEKIILHFVKDGRLEMKIADGSIVCEKCGLPVTSGRLCKNCSNTLSNTLNGSLPQKQASKTFDAAALSKSKMHVER